jgi:hypothetical protein
VLAQCFGLGALLEAIFGCRAQRGAPLDLAETYYLLATGLAAHLALILLGTPLSLLRWGGLGLAMLGLALFYFRRRPTLVLSDIAPVQAAIAGVLLLAVSWMCISTPLVTWDARSVWYFHAKIIYFAGRLAPDAGWRDPNIQWTHIFYPKLGAGLAAEIASWIGYWNEYLPKAALIVPFFIILVGFVSISVRAPQPWLCSALMVASCLTLMDALWNGYQDGHLALYGAIATVQLGTFVERGNRVDLRNGLATLGLAACTKREGTTLALIFLAAVAVGMVLMRRRLSDRSLWPHWSWVVVPAAPSAIWLFLRKRWGFDDDFAASASASTAFHRLTNPTDLLTVVRSVIVGGRLIQIIALTGFAAVICRLKKMTIPVPARFAAACASIYVMALLAAYLATPYDLGWHLLTSADRLALPPKLMGFAALFFLLRRPLSKDSRAAHVD